MDKKLLMRLTTADISLEGLLRGQLQFLNQYYDVVGVASDTGCLDFVAQREGIRVRMSRFCRPARGDTRRQRAHAPPDQCDGRPEVAA